MVCLVPILVVCLRVTRVRVEELLAYPKQLVRLIGGTV